MHRLDRRIRLLRAKREGAFDRDQYYLERAVRARAARATRIHLRRMQPVVLITPRWSQAQRFLDDIAVDLSVGRPDFRARTLSMAPVGGRNTVEAWAWLVRALVEFSGVRVEGRAGRQAVDRVGFRSVLREVLEKTTYGPRQVLLMHAVENLPMDVRDDFVAVFAEHAAEFGSDRRFNVLLACGVDAPSFEVPGAGRIHLPDFSSGEAVDALVEYTGPTDRSRLESLVRMIGGVPALLDALGAEGERSGALAGRAPDVWRALGPLADEIRGAIAIVASHAPLAERLEHVAKHGRVDRDDTWDGALLRAGLLQEVAVGRPGRVEVRAPVFAELSFPS